jgi:hypothetical protein
MFSARRKREASSQGTARRGSVGSARVWDPALRARQAERQGETASSPAPPPEGPAKALAGALRAVLEEELGESELTRALESRLRARLGLAPLTPPEPALPPESHLPEAAPAAAPPQRQPTPAARALELVLDDRLQRLGGPLTARADLRARLVNLATSLLEREEAPAVTPASASELGDLDLLRRRAAKLARSLLEARAALAHLARLEHVDEGLASIYRAVQGLDAGDPRREQKSDALARVFRANLALQKPGCA